MKLLERILMAVDFGPETEPVAQCASQLARAFRAEVIPLHVVAGGGSTVAAGDRDAAMERLQTVRQTMVERGAQVGEPLVEPGDPARAISARARQLTANLVMVGTGSRRRRGQEWIGHVAEAVVCRGHKSVWLVKRGDWPEVPQVMCPVDFFDTSRRVLQTALHLARNCRSPLETVAVAETPRGLLARLRSSREPSEELLERTRANLKNLLGEYDLHNVKVEQTVIGGRAHEGVLNQVQRSGAHLLVVGSVARGSLTSLCLSLTQRLIRAVPCSILAVKRDPPFHVRLEADGARADELFAEGEELLKHGLPEEAIRQFERCIHQNPMYVDAWGGIALAYERLGDGDRADHAWQQAWQLRERLWELQAEAEIRSNSGN